MGSRRLVGAGLMRRFRGVNVGSGVSPGQSAPAFVSGPTVSIPFLEIGQTATVTPGTVTGTPTPTRTYQWQRDGVNIGGATATTYVLTRDDSDVDITCVETLTNSLGAVSSSSNALVIPTLEAQIIARYTTAGWTTSVVLLARAGDVDASSVGTWSDKSGGARDATQGTGSAKPAYGATSFNSLPGITFDGNDLLATASVDLDAFTAVAATVVFKDSTGALAMVLERSTGAGGSDGGWYIDVNETAGCLRMFGRASGNNSAITSTAEDMSTGHVITGTWDQGLSTNETLIRRDGTDISDTRPANSNTSGGLGNHALFIGGRSGGTLPLTGVIAAVVVAVGTTAIPTTAVAAVEAILKVQWATP